MLPGGGGRGGRRQGQPDQGQLFRGRHPLAQVPALLFGCRAGSPALGRRAGSPAPSPLGIVLLVSPGQSGRASHVGRPVLEQPGLCELLPRWGLGGLGALDRGCQVLFLFQWAPADQQWWR